MAREHLKCCRTKAARRHFVPTRELSIQMLVYSIVGGMSLLWGPLVGAV